MDKNDLVTPKYFVICLLVEISIFQNLFALYLFGFFGPINRKVKPLSVN